MNGHNHFTMPGSQLKTPFLQEDWRGFRLVKKTSSQPNPNSSPKLLNNQNGHQNKAFAPARSGGSTMAAALLGEDGRGYELARRLEACGAWRAWLGEAAYAAFSPSLSSPSAWDAFLSPRAGEKTARAQIQLQLQLRARALLYDKASASLFLSQSHSINDINPNFLQLHGDDVYFSLDEEKDDGSQLQSQSAFNTRYNESDNSNKWPSTWYKQFAEKFRIRHHKLPSGEKEITKRTPEGMLTYLKLSTVHKRKRQVFKDYQSPGDPISLTDETLFPEIFFPSDCVPDSALPKADGTAKRAKMEFHTVLDNLPGLTNRSPAMIERFGIMPEYYKTGNKYRGKEIKVLSGEQENLLAKKAVVRLVSGMGFESATSAPVGVLGEVLERQVAKLGKMLKSLSDGYRKDCSSVELLKMFVQLSGYSVGSLAEMTKCGNNNNNNNNNNHSRALTHQMQQQHAHSLQSQYPNNLFNAQHLQRQFHPHAQIQTLAFQQQQLQQQQQQQQQIQQQQIRRNNSNNQMRTQQQLVDVKIENAHMDMVQQHQLDSAGFGANNNNVINNSRNQQIQQQLRHQQQQQMMMANNNSNNNNNNNNNNIVQSGPQQQFKPMQSVQLQAQNVYGMRTAPVKVEAFHELVSGDTEHNKMLTSPE